MFYQKPWILQQFCLDQRTYFQWILLHSYELVHMYILVYWLYSDFIHSFICESQLSIFLLQFHNWIYSHILLLWQYCRTDFLRWVYLTNSHLLISVVRQISMSDEASPSAFLSSVRVIGIGMSPSLSLWLSRPLHRKIICLFSFSLFSEKHVSIE